MAKKEKTEISYSEAIDSYLDLKRIGIQIFEDDKIKVRAYSIGIEQTINGYIANFYYNLMDDPNLYTKKFCLKRKSEIEVFQNEVLKYLN
jgi:hypothetical protein